MFCLATFFINGIPSIFNSVVAKELKTPPDIKQDKGYALKKTFKKLS